MRLDSVADCALEQVKALQATFNGATLVHIANLIWLSDSVRCSWRIRHSGRQFVLGPPATSPIDMPVVLLDCH